jgi:hypothetical protein
MVKDGEDETGLDPRVLLSLSGDCGVSEGVDTLAPGGRALVLVMTMWKKVLAKDSYGGQLRRKFTVQQKLTSDQMLQVSVVHASSEVLVAVIRVRRCRRTTMLLRSRADLMA